MNRRGELGWNLETIGKLIIGVATLIVIVYLSMKLIGLFVAGGDDAATGKSFEYLESQVQYAISSGKPTSVIIKTYGNAMIIGFDGDEPEFSLEETSYLAAPYMCGGAITRPENLCDEGVVCICLMRLSFTERQDTLLRSCFLPVAEPMDCFSVNQDDVFGTFTTTGAERTGVNYPILLDTSADSTHPAYTQTFAILSALQPQNALIRVSGRTLLIDTRATPFTAGGGSFGGAGATATY